MSEVKDTYITYILECSDGTLYTGITNDLERRISQHNGKSPGGAKYTRGRNPVRVRYVEEFSCFSDAAKREHEIKKLSRKDKIRLVEWYTESI